MAYLTANNLKTPETKKIKNAVMEKKWRSIHSRLSETCSCSGCQQAKLRYITKYGVQDKVF